MMKQSFLFFFLLNTLTSVCQDEALQSLQLKLENDIKSFPSEKLFVHTDKSFYTTGEIIWFKIYKCGDSVNRDAVSSKLVYVDLVDNRQVTVLKAKIEMDPNHGDGALELPLSLNSGYYTFRAYSNWMKNFGPEHFFQKQITIVNPFKNIQPDSDTAVLNSLDLFPEGGNLVNGILSQVAFEIKRRDNPVNGKGFLLDENNDTVSRFVPYKYGMGAFYFTPEKIHHYKVVFIFDDNSFVTKSLPPIFDAGYVMHIDEDIQKINVTVHTTEPGSSEIFLVAHNHEKIKAAKKNLLFNGVAVFSVNKAELGQGISQITVFDKNKQPVCERLFFILPAQKTVLTSSLSKEIYSKREEVSLSVSNASQSPADFSVAVFKADSFQTNDDHNIASYIWLESELQGTIENPRFYLSGNSEEIKKATDYLMLTHGWRRFDWNPNSNTATTIKFLPEVLGQMIFFKITDSITGNPAKNVQVVLSIPQTNYQLFSAISNDSGMVQFRTNEFYGKGELVVQTFHPAENYKIELVNPFSERYTAQLREPFKISPDKKPLLENYSISMQSQQIYNSDSIQKYLAPALKDTFAFFGSPQKFYLLDNYTRFTTMEEVLREYVYEINVGVKGKGNLKFKLLNESNQTYYTQGILVMVDGIPIPDPDKIFSMDPLKVRRIDVIPENYMLGNAFFYGLANFSTYKENHEGIDLDPRAVVLDYEGLQMKRKFYAPDYSNNEQRLSRIPDLRTTLFWSAQADINKPIHFFTGDNKGQYRVVIQGINNKGEPLITATQFEVK